jgi:hypothetical protein
MLEEAQTCQEISLDIINTEKKIPHPTRAGWHVSFIFVSVLMGKSLAQPPPLSSAADHHPWIVARALGLLHIH